MSSVDDVIQEYLEEISKHPGHDDQKVHAGQAAGAAGVAGAGAVGAREIKRRSGAREAARTNLAMATRTTLPEEGSFIERLRTSAGDASGRASSKKTKAGMKARALADEARPSALKNRAGTAAEGAGSRAASRATRAGMKGRHAAEMTAESGKLVGESIGGKLKGVGRKLKRNKNIWKAYDMYDEVEKFRNPRQAFRTKRTLRVGQGKPIGMERARQVGSKVRAGANQAGESAIRGAHRAGGAISSNRGAAAAIGGGVGAAGAGGYVAGRRRKEDRFGKAEHVYEIAKAFRQDRLAGNVAHEYDLTTDPDLYSEIADRFVAKGLNADYSDVDAVYAEMGGDWVPVEDVLVELSKALWDGDDETAQLIAYALS